MRAAWGGPVPELSFLPAPCRADMNPGRVEGETLAHFARPGSASPFARLGSAPIWGKKKGEFMDWTRRGEGAREQLTGRLSQEVRLQNKLSRPRAPLSGV